jgi:rhamnose utilization protein RhaD (predicted bifunctional aldolase and dehydrogenase)
LHGGGNTSVKLVIKNKLGEDVEVIAVKGSGWDLSNIGLCVVSSFATFSGSIFDVVQLN